VSTGRASQAYASRSMSSDDDLGQLADEQAALRRVASLVAAGVAPERVFAAVTDEVGRLLPVDVAIMGRYETSGTVTCVAAWGAQPPASRSAAGRSSRERTS
jgi:hypothetical protein